MARADTVAEISRLEAIARKRKGAGGYAENVRDIEARLEALRAELANGGN